LHYKSALPADIVTINDDNTREWYKPLKEIPEGTDLFEVWGWSKPKSCDGEYHKIAVIRLQTKLYTSVAGDNRLYFQHRRVTGDRRYWNKCGKDLNEDLKFPKNENTVWGIADLPVYDEWPTDREEAEEEYNLQLAENNGCPFAWLLDE